MDIIDLQLALKDAGFDIASLCGNAQDIRITQWASSPTAEQVAAAQAFIKAFDWSHPAMPTNLADFEKATGRKQDDLLNAMLLEWVQGRPYLWGKLK